jgi:hypothetical protein
MSRNSSRHSEDIGRGGNPAASGKIPSSFAGRLDPRASDRMPFTSSRYSDGRSSVYRAPDRYANMSRHDDYRGASDYHGSSYRSMPYRYSPSAYRYDHHAFSPVWHGPVVYPAGNSFGFSWSNGSFGLSFASYSPSYAYSTRYYDSWSCGGWGYSRVYYGGWHNNWYGGFSYVYNPWPVYRTCYLYEPEPLVIPAEPLYVAQPATTTYIVQSAAAAPRVQQPAAAVAEAPQPQAVWEDAPAVDRAETLATSCFCSCHCNGQRPCTCDYPCGSEYAVVADQFNLSVTYSPYAELLNPEVIWSSYAGLDRENAYAEPNLGEATASTGMGRR